MQQKIWIFSLALWGIIVLAQEPEVFVQLGHFSYVNAVVFSPDGKFALSGSSDHRLKLWDVSTGREIRTFEGHASSVNAVAFSPDGKFALSGDSHHLIKLWDISTGHEIRTFDGHASSITALAFSHNGQLALSGSYDRTLKLWEVSTGREIQTFEGHGASITALAFSPDSQFALSASFDETVKLWEVSTGQEIWTFEEHTDAVTAVAFSPDGNLVLSGSADQTVKLWNVSTGHEIRTFEHTSSITAVAFSLDGEFALSASSNNLVKALSIGEEVKRWKGNNFWGNAVAFSPDGKFVLSGEHRLQLWDISSGRGIRFFEGHSYSVNSVAFSPDGQLALSGSETLQLWHVSTGREIRRFEGHRSAINSVAFSPDGKFVLSGSKDKTLKLWNLSTGELIRTYEGHAASISAVAFSPDGEFILSGSMDKTLKLWDVSSGREIQNFEGHASWVNAVAFSPDGKFALSASKDETLKLWDVSTGDEIRTFEGHAFSVTAVAFSPDGKFALSGSKDQSLKLWDISSGRAIRTFEGHTASVNAVAFSPDGILALSGSQDETLKLWDVSTGREIRTFKGHAAWVKAVAFSPDGILAMSGSFDGSTRLWHVQNGEEFARLLAFKNGEWATLSPQGYYVASAGGEKYINVSVGTQVSTVEPYRAEFNRPKLLKVILQSCQIDTSPPLVLDGGVTDRFVINTTTYRLRGQAIDNSGVAQVTVNGQVASLNKQGYFSLELPLQIGENPVEIIATDIFKNSTHKNLILIREDITPPRLLGIDDKIVVKNTTSYFLQAQVIDDTEVASLSINGEIVPLDKKGYFSVELPVQIGENLVEITAMDIFNNRFSKKILLIRQDINPPRLVGIDDKIVVVNRTTYTLRGQVTDEMGVASVIINGQVVHLDKQGYFSYQVTLPIGRKKHLRIIATDIDDNRANQDVILEHRCTGEALSPEEFEIMVRDKVKIAFEGEAILVSKDISPSCLPQAVFLDLSHLALSTLPVWLARLKQLRKLDISYNKLSPEDLSAPLGKLSVLEDLDLSHNPLFTEFCWMMVWCEIKPIMPAIWQHLSGLRVLNLSHTGGDAENYGDLPQHLSQLDLSHNRLSGVASLNLAQFKELRRLYLSHNRLKEIDFADLSPRLETLDLSHNALGHLTFAPLPFLSQLDLKANDDVSFDVEFGAPFTLPALGEIEFDDGVRVPEGLSRKLDN